MHFSTITVASILALASSAVAGRAVVHNNCDQDLYLTIARGNGARPPQVKIPKNGGEWSEDYQGVGNSLGITKNANFYSASTPKLVFGYSDQPPTVYYSVSNQDGNIGLPWHLDGSGSCPDFKTVSGTKACGDNEWLYLYVC